MWLSLQVFTVHLVLRTWENDPMGNQVRSVQNCWCRMCPFQIRSNIWNPWRPLIHPCPHAASNFVAQWFVGSSLKIFWHAEWRSWKSNSTYCTSGAHLVLLTHTVLFRLQIDSFSLDSISISQNTESCDVLMLINFSSVTHYLPLAKSIDVKHSHDIKCLLVANTDHYLTQVVKKFKRQP